VFIAENIWGAEEVHILGNLGRMENFEKFWKELLNFGEILKDWKILARAGKF
jgi:hypothetical protein